MKTLQAKQIEDDFIISVRKDGEAKTIMFSHFTELVCELAKFMGEAEPEHKVHTITLEHSTDRTKSKTIMRPMKLEDVPGVEVIK